MEMVKAHLMTYSLPMLTVYEYPQCGAARTGPRDRRSHCLNIEDHAMYDVERLISLLNENQWELQLATR
jgi:hypothetical protein